MIDTARPQQRLLTSNAQTHSLSDGPTLLRIHRFSRMRTAEVPASNCDDAQYEIELAKSILSRIESRLPGRLRHLTVYASDNTVELNGECSTFYTKQLAQHIAMGVLEYEQLINHIDVRVAK